MDSRSSRVQEKGYRLVDGEPPGAGFISACVTAVEYLQQS